MRIALRPLTVCLLALALLSPLGCNSSAGGQGSGSGAAISGPLTILPDYQARAPRTCSAVNSPPNASQATVMVQCSMDALTDTGLGLIQDVKLQIGKPRPFVEWTDGGLLNVDLTATIYPLQGSYTGYFCNLISNMAPAGQSCLRSAVPAAQGWCWKTSFGDYKCKMQGGAPATIAAQPAPKTF
jgi:hypothetical protein